MFLYEKVVLELKESPLWRPCKCKVYGVVSLFLGAGDCGLPCKIVEIVIYHTKLIT